MMSVASMPQTLALPPKETDVEETKTGLAQNYASQKAGPSTVSLRRSMEAPKTA